MASNVRHLPWSPPDGARAERQQVCTEDGEPWPCITAQLGWAVSGELWRDLDTESVRAEHSMWIDEGYPDLTSLCVQCAEPFPCTTVRLAGAYDVRRAELGHETEQASRRRRLSDYLPNRSDNLALVSLNDTRPFRAYWPMRFVQLIGGATWSISFCRYRTPAPIRLPAQQSTSSGAAAQEADSQRVVRLVVNLAPSTAEALKSTAKASGLSITEAIRRAIGTWKFLHDERAAGRRIMVVTGSGEDASFREVLEP